MLQIVNHHHDHHHDYSVISFIRCYCIQLFQDDDILNNTVIELRALRTENY